MFDFDISLVFGLGCFSAYFPSVVREVYPCQADDGEGYESETYGADEKVIGNNFNGLVSHKPSKV